MAYLPAARPRTLPANLTSYFAIAALLAAPMTLALVTLVYGALALLLGTPDPRAW